MVNLNICKTCDTKGEENMTFLVSYIENHTDISFYLCNECKQKWRKQIIKDYHHNLVVEWEKIDTVLNVYDKDSLDLIEKLSYGDYFSTTLPNFDCGFYAKLREREVTFFTFWHNSQHIPTQQESVNAIQPILDYHKTLIEKSAVWSNFMKEKSFQIEFVFSSGHVDVCIAIMKNNQIYYNMQEERNYTPFSSP